MEETFEHSEESSSTHENERNPPSWVFLGEEGVTSQEYKIEEEVSHETEEATHETEDATPDLEQTVSLFLTYLQNEKEFTLAPKTSVVVGRTPKAGSEDMGAFFFPINEMDISRKHLELFWDGIQLSLKALSDSGVTFDNETLKPPQTHLLPPAGSFKIQTLEKKREFVVAFKIPQLLTSSEPTEVDDDRTRIFQPTGVDDDRTRIFQTSEDVTRFDIQANPTPTEKPLQVTLKVLGGVNPGKSATFTFTKSGDESRIYIGRSQDNEFPIEETWISRIHASLLKREGKLFLRRETQYDNSVWIENQALSQHQEFPLKSQGEIILCASSEKLTLHYETEGVAPASAVATSSNAAVSGVKLTEFLLETSLPGAIAAHIDVISSKLHYLLGTDAQCDYYVTHQKEYVASRHAEITFDPQSRLYFIRCVAERTVGMQVNGKSVYEQSPLQDGDHIRLGLDSKAPELIFRADTSIIHEEEGGEPLFYAKVEFRWEDEEKTKEVKLQGVARVSVARTGVRLLLGTASNANYVISRPGALEKHALLALTQDESETLHLKLENLSRENFEVEDGNRAIHSLPKHNHMDLQYQSGRIKLGPNLPWLEYRIIPEKPLEGVLTELSSSAVTSRKKLSELIPQPTQGTVYRIGSNPEMEIVIPDIDFDLALLEIKPDDDKFVIRRKTNTKARVLLDGNEILPGEQKKFHFGENLILGSIDITNDFRVLVAPKESNFLKNLLIGLAGLFFIMLVATVIYFFSQQNFLNTQKLTLENHVQNVVLVMSSDRNGLPLAHGTGFLWKDQDTVYVLSSKTTLQPWKYDAHKKPIDRQLERANQDILDLPTLTSVWFNGDRVRKEHEILFKNAFTDHPTEQNEQRPNPLEIVSTEALESYQEVEGGFRKLLAGQLSELAILKIKGYSRNVWKWDFVEAKEGLKCFASYYTLKPTAEKPILDTIAGTLQKEPGTDFFTFVPEKSASSQEISENLAGAVIFEEQGNIVGMLLKQFGANQNPLLLNGIQIRQKVKELSQ